MSQRELTCNMSWYRGRTTSTSSMASDASTAPKHTATTSTSTTSSSSSSSARGLDSAYASVPSSPDRVAASSMTSSSSSSVAVEEQYYHRYNQRWGAPATDAAPMTTSKAPKVPVITTTPPSPFFAKRSQTQPQQQMHDHGHRDRPNHDHEHQHDDLHTLCDLPREVIQQHVLPHLSVDDLCALRCSCWFLHATVDEMRPYKVLWRVTAVYRQQQERGPRRRSNPVIQLVHDTIAVMPPPAVPPPRMAESAVRLYTRFFPRERPHLKTPEAVVDVASVAALVGAARVLHHLLTLPPLLAAEHKQRSAAMLLCMRVAVKMGHVACIRAIFDAIGKVADSVPPLICRESLLAFFDQSLQNGHADAARLLAGKANYSEQQQVADALHANAPVLNSPRTVDYFLSLSVPEEDLLDLASIAVAHACEDGNVALLDHLLRNHAQYARVHVPHIEAAVSRDRAFVLACLHNALDLRRQHYTDTLPGLTHAWPLLGQMCRCGAVKCLDFVRRQFEFDDAMLAIVSTNLMSMCAPSFGFALSRVLQFLTRTQLHARVPVSCWQAVAAGCCRFGFTDALHVLLTQCFGFTDSDGDKRSSTCSACKHVGGNDNSDSSSDAKKRGCASNTATSIPTSPSSSGTTTTATTSATPSATPSATSTHPIMHVDRRVVRNMEACAGCRLVVARAIFLTTEEAAFTQQCPLLTAVLGGYTGVVGMLHKYGVFSHRDESRLRLLTTLVRAMGHAQRQDESGAGDMHSPLIMPWARADPAHSMSPPAPAAMHPRAGDALTPRRRQRRGSYAATHNALAGMSLRHGVRLSSIHSSAGMLNLLWEEVGLARVYLQQPKDLCDLLSHACCFDLMDVLNLVLLDLDDSAVAQSALTAVQAWPQDVQSTHAAQLVVRHLMRRS
ncbi:hypothetical protein PTSG_09753 [Salpingoeca rosetta]|uniref:Uncharacterized protein n=1 Tax=Salpingoeca rosetta (strain ATCC 50818 / BSB-021) TaxID=946362 RepID=F2UNY4_SALR5|nr:uncharacterized protein PTSG_09753 [Salpingoeca rosetta]EGD79339.1 hypothetical protein PTSG_09753 [Salpingoeca rosetta]|eukprot:XP_004989108.1 hypothetical protein PTSG_09753 [Salpingoeca rosetta]